MDGQLLAILAFAAAVATVLAVGSLVHDLWLRNRWRIGDRFDSQFGSKSTGSANGSTLFHRLDVDSGDGERTVVHRLRIALEHSGLSVTVSQLLGLSAVGSLVAATMSVMVGPHWVFALPAAAVVFLTPLIIVLSKHRARQKKLAGQLPEAFELLSRAVRAGQTLPSAMQLVANDGKAPLSEEFAHCCEQQSLGLSQEMTLRELARRNDIMELQMFAVAMIVQRQSGGSPVELLDNLSGVVRKRIRMRGRVKALTGEGRMQAIVLSVLPIVAFVAIFFLKHDYASLLIDRPRLLAGMAASTVVGALWIRRIVNFEY